MTTEHDPDIDPVLARRLQALHQDLPDDGFTATVMAQVHAQAETAQHAPAPASVIAAQHPDATPLLTLAAAALVIAIAAMLGDFDPGTANLLVDRIDTAIAAPASTSVSWFTQQLHQLVGQHLTLLMGAFAALLAMLLPTVLEDT